MNIQMNYPKKNKPTNPIRSGTPQPQSPNDVQSIQGYYAERTEIRTALDPDILSQYESIQPGLAGRVLGLLEKKGDQSHELNKQIIDNSFKLSSGGQNKGLIAVALMVLLCGFGFYLGYPKEAAWLGGAVIVSLAGIFVIGRAVGSKPPKESKKKREQKES